MPALSLLVTIYRYFTDPATIAEQLDTVTTMFPQAARELIHEQAMRLSAQSGFVLSVTFYVSLLVAAWSANAAVKARLRRAEHHLSRDREAQLPQAQR